MTGQPGNPGPLTLTCAACGRSWIVRPRPDGAMPQGSRCPRSAGGCGKFRAVPRPARRPRGPRIDTGTPAGRLTARILRAVSDYQAETAPGGRRKSETGSDTTDTPLTQPAGPVTCGDTTDTANAAGLFQM